MSLDRPSSEPAGHATEAGLFLVLVALPLIFTPAAATSFADPKLVVLLGGTFLLALGRPVVDRRLALAAAAWVAVLLVAAGAGLDPWWSVIGPEHQSTGVLTLTACAFLLCAGTSIDDHLRARLPAWLFGAGVAVAGVAVLARFVDVGGSTWRLHPLASTIGPRVAVGGFLAAAAIAACAVRHRSPTYAALVVLGSGLAVSAVRSAWVGAALGLVLVGARDRDRRRQVVVVGVLVAATLGAWTAADRVLPAQELEFSAAPRFTQLGEGSAAERPNVWSAYLRAWRHDPWLGSGPGTGWHGYLRHATDDELRGAERGYADAHNVVIEMLVTTGLIGTVALGVLATFVLLRLRRSHPDRSWAMGVTASLTVAHLLQPLSVVLTPLLFLCAGLAIPRQRDPLRVPRWAGAIPLAVALGLACLRLGASLFENYGTTYGSAAALRWSLRLEPRRIGAAVQLANHRSFDHLAGDDDAAADARAHVGRVVREHPWHPQARIDAAKIESILGGDAAAMRWLDRQLELFPHDALALAGQAALAERIGDLDRARAHARRALEIQPDLRIAQQLLERTAGD